MPIIYALFEKLKNWSHKQRKEHWWMGSGDNLMDSAKRKRMQQMNIAIQIACFIQHYLKWDHLFQLFRLYSYLNQWDTYFDFVEINFL